MAWSPDGLQLAFELQHTSIGLEEIEKRAFCYACEGIAQIWIPFLRASELKAAEPHGAGRMFIEKYSPRPFEKWVHGLFGKDGMWMYAPHDKTFWHARLAGHQIYVEESSWFEAGGEERTAGGFYRWSKRYRELTLSGPHSINNLDIKIGTRKAASLAGYNWPAGRFATLSPNKSL
jgi:competence protein CoiA